MSHATVKISKPQKGICHTLLTDLKLHAERNVLMYLFLQYVNANLYHVLQKGQP